MISQSPSAWSREEQDAFLASFLDPDENRTYTGVMIRFALLRVRRDEGENISQWIRPDEDESRL